MTVARCNALLKSVDLQEFCTYNHSVRRLNLTLADPLCLTLAADARLSPVNYVNDIIWQVVLGGGAPPALAVETRLGLRALDLRIFPRFLRQESDLVDPLEFSSPPVVQEQLPGYLLITAAPFSGIHLSMEVWIAASSTIAGRLTLRNDSILSESLRVQLCGLLSPLGDGRAFSPQELDASTVLAGKTSGLCTLLLTAGEPRSASGPYPNLTHEVDLYPGSEKQIQWAFAALPEMEDALQLARLTCNRPLDAEVTRAELLHTSQCVQVVTPRQDWNAALYLGQTAAMRLLMPPGPALPRTGFVLAREAEHGYSLRGDGSDYTHLWNGATALDAWYLAGLLLPGAPILARGLVENLLASARPDGAVDFKPGPAGQRSQILAQPILASLALKIHQATPEPAWIKHIYPPLLTFVRLWMSKTGWPEKDCLPVWEHVLQSGLEQAPIVDRWHPGSQGADIRQVVSPALGAFLYRECRSLLEMARLLRKAEDAAWLESAAEAARTAVEACWDEKAGTYRYRDIISRQSLPGAVLLQSQTDGKTRLRRKFTPARRLYLRILSPGGPAALTLHLRGQDAAGQPCEESLTPQQIRWLQNCGRGHSQAFFSQIETVEVLGLPDGADLSLYTLDYTQPDISLLLPLWAAIPDPERARTLIESTLLPRYLRPYGLSICPVDENPMPNPQLACALLPWNDLLGEGLAHYGYHHQAADLFGRLMDALVNTLKLERAFIAPLCSLEQPASGEKNVLSALPPLGLLGNILGLHRISTNEVILQNQCPLPGPITVQYLGTDITFQTKSSVVRFPGGESVTVTKPGLRRIHR